ncbi:hypothetical protein D6827_00195, partial [Candidatus Parcubacteria bacterium]
MKKNEIDFDKMTDEEYEAWRFVPASKTNKNLFYDNEWETYFCMKHGDQHIAHKLWKNEVSCCLCNQEARAKALDELMETDADCM